MYIGDQLRYFLLHSDNLFILFFLALPVGEQNFHHLFGLGVGLELLGQDINLYLVHFQEFFEILQLFPELVVFVLKECDFVHCMCVGIKILNYQSVLLLLMIMILLFRGIRFFGRMHQLLTFCFGL